MATTSQEELESFRTALRAQIAVAEQMIERTNAQRDGFGNWPGYVALAKGDPELLERWISSSEAKIRLHLGEHERKRFNDSVTNWSHYSKSTISGFRRCLSGLDFLNDLLRVATDFPYQLTYTEPAISRRSQLMGSKSSIAPTRKSSSSVFLIHGRDEVNLLRLDRLLRDKYSLNVCVLSDKPAQGRTLIEKFEKEAGDCGYAFCLLTPDDQIGNSTAEYAQGRPNAVFELGCFKVDWGVKRHASF